MTTSYHSAANNSSSWNLVTRRIEIGSRLIVARPSRSSPRARAMDAIDRGVRGLKRRKRRLKRHRRSYRRSAEAAASAADDDKRRLDVASEPR